MTSFRNELINICKEFHEGQFDSQGAPYWLHPYRVALDAEDFVKSIEFDAEVDLTGLREDAFIVGLFHDVLEDVDDSWEELYDLLDEFPGTFDSVVRLTMKHQYFKEYLHPSALLARQFAKTYEEKIDVLISSRDLVAMIVKLSDNEDNSLLWRSKKYGVPNPKYIRSRIMLREAIIKEFEAND